MRRARWATRAQFAILGTFAGAWGAHIPSVKSCVAIAEFALVGAGLAPVAPALYNAATRVPGISRAAAIASVSSIGYGGFMIGPPLIGSLAHAASLSVALGVVAAAAGLLACSARYVPAAARPRAW